MENEKYILNFTPEILTPGADEIVRAIYTLPNQEQRLWKFCQDSGIVSYLPLKKVWKLMRQSHGGKVYSYPKQVLRPMFTGYVFIRMNTQQRADIFKSKAVARILQSSDFEQDRLIADIQTISQIEQIALSEELDFNAEIKEGSRFLIESGPWQGVYGWLKKKNKRFLWTVEIESVNTIIQATIDPSLYKMTKA